MVRCKTIVCLMRHFKLMQYVFNNFLQEWEKT